MRVIQRIDIHLWDDTAVVYYREEARNYSKKFSLTVFKDVLDYEYLNKLIDKY